MAHDAKLLMKASESRHADRLLAIDDEPELLAIVARAAEEQGFQVRATTDPDTFKATLHEFDPTVIMLDLQMPGCDGVELLRYLSQHDCRSHVTLISGVEVRLLKIAKNVGEGLGLKMTEPLHKPIRVAALKSVLTQLAIGPFKIDSASLSAAIDADHLELHYQPVVRLMDSSLVGYEALVRWRHPERGVIMPDQFIAIAEREGLIDRLTDKVVEIAVAQLAAWQRDHGNGSFVSVNISALNLDDWNLPDRVERLCARHGVPPARLRFELTETAAMSESVRHTEILTRLRLKGFKLAIDDFGTGYSSLLRLRHLPFSELKIDRSFTRDLTTSEDAQVIVNAIAGLAHALGMELIAEGVESEHASAQLRNADCEMAQGYHFGRPMPPGEALAWRGKPL